MPSAAGTVQVRSGGNANDTAPDSERSASGSSHEDHCDLPALQDMFENFDVSHLEELAETLLAGIGADLEDIDRASRSTDAEGERTSQCLSGSVVGSTAAIVESSRPETPTGNRLILTTHNYSKSPFYELSDAPQQHATVQPKKEQEDYDMHPDHAITLQHQQPATILPNSDTIYGTYDNETNCITIVLADDEEVSETTVTCMDGPDTAEPSEEIILLEQAEDETMETSSVRLTAPLSSEPFLPLAPITIRPPSPLQDLLSPIAHQPLKSPGGFSSVSDAGYESLGSPTPVVSNASKTIPSDPCTMSLDYALSDDFNEFWNLDPLFPILE
uniref:Uncharacterized protein n=1 Tax=Anopheles funestus TaxID=62324 RepID=A0A4Y0BFB4_ANOFN